MGAGRTFRWLGARPGCQSRQWGHESPILCLRGNGSILPCLQLWWGTCHSYRGPLFSDEVGKTQPCLVWLSCLHFNFKPFISACFPVFENKFFFVLLHRGRGALGNSRGSFGSLPHLGLGSSAPFIVPLPTVTPVQRGGQCLIFKPVLLLFSYRCFLSLLPQNVLIWHHKHRPTGLEGPHGVA